MTQILIQNIQDKFKMHLKTMAFLPVFLTLFFIGGANLTSYSQACSQVTFRNTFTGVLNTTATENFHNDITTADFNADGNLDMVVADQTADLVSIFLGDGKGNFTVSTLTAGNNPGRVFTRDFNRDGKMDLAVMSDNNIVFFNGTGNGSFTIVNTITLTNIDMTVADFNLDGKEDFARVAGSNTFSVHLGNGNGTFGSPLSTPISPAAGFRLLGGDFNSDGKPDIVMTAQVTTLANQMRFFAGDGLGGFSAAVNFDLLVTGPPLHIETGNLNSDGKPDLIVSSTNGANNSQILLGATSGIFTVSNIITSPSLIASVRIADLNADGKPDLFIAKGFAIQDIEVHLGNGSGTFTLAGQTQIPNNLIDSTGSVLGDFNNDGKLDFAVTGRRKVHVGLNQCGGLTDKPKIDFDGDGKSDAVVFRPSTGQWFVLRSSNNSFFAFPFGSDGDLPAAGDFDGDGRTDAAVFRPSTGQWFVISTANNAVTTFQFGLNGDKPAVGDYDGDGKADIAVFRPSSGLWFVLRSSDGGATIFQWGVSTDIIIQ